MAAAVTGRCPRVVTAAGGGVHACGTVSHRGVIVAFAFNQQIVCVGHTGAGEGSLREGLQRFPYGVWLGAVVGGSLGTGSCLLQLGAGGGHQGFHLLEEVGLLSGVGGGGGLGGAGH